MAVKKINNEMIIIGVAGLAQAGKDTFFDLVATNPIADLPYVKLSFADEVKEDLDAFVKSKFGFSAFTEVQEEKEIIRPLLVAWGTHVMRAQDEDHWIKKLSTKLKHNTINIITDARYPNECSWIKKHLKGRVIYLSRDDVKPPNEEEAKNDPIIKQMANKTLHWETFIKKDELKNAYGTICNSILEGFFEEFFLKST